MSSGSTTQDRYARRGVSSGKEEVHAAISGIDKGLFPKAFCKVVPDALTGSEEHCLVQPLVLVQQAVAPCGQDLYAPL